MTQNSQATTNNVTLFGITTDNHNHRATATGGGSSTGARACARAREAEAAMLRGQYVDCCEYYTRSFRRGLPFVVRRDIATRIKAGMSADVIMAAMDETMTAPRPSWAYCAAILRRCDLEGIRTLEDWHESKRRFEAAKNPALDYQQRNYTEDHFGEDFFLDLDKYGEG